MMARGLAAIAACALFVLLAGTPAAQGFSIEDPTATTESAQAGANANVTISFDVGEPAADLRDLTIHLPPGLVGNPLAVPQCTEEQLETAETGGPGCPASTQVGTVTNDVTLSVLGFVPVHQTVHGALYNVVPRPGEPARFGIILRPDEAIPLPIGSAVLPPIVMQSPARLRQSDLGLDSVLEELPRTATVLGTPVEIDINGIELVLHGQVGNPPQGFIRLPTSCKEHTVGFSARAYNDATATASTTFTTTGCANVPFSPELTAWVRPRGQGLPADFSTTISQTIEEAGLARAEVTLPRGLIGDIVVLSNTCARDVFFSATCPDGTVVGEAVATSPLQAEALSGPVNALAPAAPGLPDLGLDLRGPLSLKLTGQTALLPEGRVMNTFAGLPDIPIADFTLTFPRERKLILTDDLCASDEPLLADVRFVAHSGAELTARPRVEVRGCGPAAKPRASVKLNRPNSKRPRVVLRARAGTRPLRSAKLRLPKALRPAKQRKLRRRSVIRADGDKVKARRLKRGKRAVTVRLGSANKVRVQLRRGALRRAGKLGKRPRFRVVLTDTAGKKHRLRVRAK